MGEQDFLGAFGAVALGIALIVTGGVWWFGDAKTMRTAVLAFGYLLIVGAGKKYQ